MLQCVRVAVCCSVLQCVAVCCNRVVSLETHSQSTQDTSARIPHMYIPMYTHTYIHIYIPVHTHKCAYTHTGILSTEEQRAHAICVYTYVYTYIHTYIYIFLYIFTYTYTHIYIFPYVYTYAHMHNQRTTAARSHHMGWLRLVCFLKS